VPGSGQPPDKKHNALRTVRDAQSVAAHTTGYFCGWRRGQEIAGYAAGAPGREGMRRGREIAGYAVGDRTASASGDAGVAGGQGA
jgi:hypothetical protein